MYSSMMGMQNRSVMMLGKWEQGEGKERVVTLWKMAVLPQVAPEYAAGPEVILTLSLGSQEKGYQKGSFEDVERLELKIIKNIIAAARALDKPKVMVLTQTSQSTEAEMAKVKT